MLTRSYASVTIAPYLSGDKPWSVAVGISSGILLSVYHDISGETRGFCGIMSFGHCAPRPDVHRDCGAKCPPMKKILVIFLVLVSAAVLVWWAFLAAPRQTWLSSNTPNSIEIISFTDDTPAVLVADKLQNSGLIKSRTVIGLLFRKSTYPAGGYELSHSMNAFEVAQAMDAGPSLLWVMVPPGWRKEQIAEKLQLKFQWTQKDMDDFLSFPEGEYFPDTYLVPRAESGKRIALRMHNNFNDKFAPYAVKFLAANIKNDTALKIASLLQRESGGDDMPLIAGIIWNRLLAGMGLKIDATVQYAKGGPGDWWPKISVSDYSSIDSLYNTYEYKGLPPTPIASSAVAAWEAVLNPAQTDCLYYLHDRLGQIHCSPTYGGHLKNVEKYLK